jgi:hypothetical protein
MWRAPLVALLLVAGCGAKIGDSCKTNIDCSPLGDRFCDLASPNGYCTQEDCSFKDNNNSTCPSEATCIRFFTPIDGEVCHTDPSTEPVPFSRADCADVDDRCVCDVTNDDGSCQGNLGHCAPSATERHWCMLTCEHDSDCRDGYQCRHTGTFGAEPLPTFANPVGKPAKFCAPKPTPF